MREGCYAYNTTFAGSSYAVSFLARGDLRCPEPRPVVSGLEMVVVWEAHRVESICELLRPLPFRIRPDPRFVHAYESDKVGFPEFQPSRRGRGILRRLRGKVEDR